jgi:hypothetical protein
MPDRGGDRVLGLRLQRQLIERSGAGAALDATLDPPGVVRHLCAIQAQDYAGALWSVGLRTGPPCTAADIELAIANRQIVRTWPMRGTLHFVAPEDVRWMLALLSPRVIARAGTRREQLGITAETVARAKSLFTDALAGGHSLTRGEMMGLLAADSISTAGQRGYHLLWTLAQDAVLCVGPVLGKQQTFVLLDEWIPRSDGDVALEPPAALARLAERYFAARGPATIADLAWWAGITKTEAHAGVQRAGTALQRVATPEAEFWMPADVAHAFVSATRIAPSRTTHLLPGFDEYFLGYADRTLPLGEQVASYGATVSANGMFSPTVIIDGRVAGTWKRTLRRNQVDISVRPFRTIGPAEKRRLIKTAEEYGRFVQREAVLAT